MLYIPPPSEPDELAVKVQFLSVGLPPLLYIPPPLPSEYEEAPSALPAVIVNPSSTAVEFVSLPTTTW